MPIIPGLIAKRLSDTKRDRWETKAAEGNLSTRKLGELQTMQEADALASGAYEPTEAEIQQKAALASMQAGQQIQGAAQGLAGQMIAGGQQNRGAITRAMGQLGAGAGEAGAQALMGTRALEEQIAQGKIEAAKARILQESQTARDRRLGYTQTILGPAGGAAEGASSAAVAALIGCWVAEELYGVDHMKTHLARYWAMTHDNWFTRLYSKHGQHWAGWLKNHPWAKPVVQPIWDVMAFLGLQSIVEVPHGS